VPHVSRMAATQVAKEMMEPTALRLTVQLCVAEIIRKRRENLQNVGLRSSIVQRPGQARSRQTRT